MSSVACKRKNRSVTVVAHEIHDRGGMERVLAELIRRASARYQITVVARELDPSLRHLVTWRRVPVPRKPFPLKYVLFWIYAGIALGRCRGGIIHTQGALVPNRADVASIHLCHRAVRRAGIPRGYGSLPRRLNSGISRLLALAAEQWCYRRDRLRVAAAVSPAVVRDMQAYYPAVQVTLTPNGVDLGRFAPQPRSREEVRQEQQVPNETLVALFVGGEWKLKGLDLVVSGVASAARDGLQVALWVVGSGDNSWLNAVVADEGIQDRVSCLGVRADVERILAAADVLVLPSAYETFSLVAHEAAAAAVPIIATRVGGIEQILEAGGGVAVSRSPAEIAAALHHLASNAQLREDMGAAGREYARRLTWDRSAEAVFRLWEGLFATRG